MNPLYDRVAHIERVNIVRQDFNAVTFGKTRLGKGFAPPRRTFNQRAADWFLRLRFVDLLLAFC